MDGGDNTYHPRCLDCGCTAPFDAWQSRTPAPAEVERHGISEGRAMVIAHSEPFQEQPDPLSEWKALEPGRKVLNKISKRVWSIVSFSERDNCYQLVDPENKEVGTSLGSSREDFENNYQILHEGPFDAGKLQYGDWLWDEHYRQWVQFKEIASDGLIGIISHGINYYINPYNPNLYFAPPSREERIEKALSNTTPYLLQDVKGVYKYEIDSPDELDAGLHGFRDEVTVIVDSGDPGGDPTGEDSFEEHMRQALIEWFDGAKVVFKKAGE